MKSAVETIVAKRDGRKLPAGEIRELLHAYTRGEVPEAQMAALLMAIVFQGLDAEELRAWLHAMLETSERLTWGEGPVVDKHSTGGVGDKTSLVVAPLLAAAGAKVPMLSGRGLGTTGGTLDKLEAVPGLSVQHTREELQHLVETVGCFIAGTTPGIVPADRALYALRDVTGTVESLPLIAASIISKKVAGGSKALVLDVKVGRGGLNPDLSGARLLADTMRALGEELGVATSCAVTRMDLLLGQSAGNACEVAEARAVLRGEGPSDVAELSLALAEEGARLAGLGSPDLRRLLADGSAAERFEEMLSAQGATGEDLPAPAQTLEVRARAAGTVRGFDARAAGKAAWRLGAGRSRPGETVDPTAGVTIAAPTGSEVGEGDVVALVHSSSRPLEEAAALVRGAIVLEEAEADAETSRVVEWRRGEQ